MLSNETVEKLRYMKLPGMASAFLEQTSNNAMAELDFEERFGLIVDFEYSKRRDAQLQRIVKNADFKAGYACLEDMKYDSDRKLDKKLIAKLSTNLYIEEHRNIIIMGATGAGKTYLGCALGNAACRKRLSVKYIRFPDLLVELAISRGNTTIHNALRKYAKYKLLILDDWLLTKVDAADAPNVLDLIDTRHEAASTIFLTQHSPSAWHELLGGGCVGEAILDRIIHGSYEMTLEGDSMRKKQSFDSKAS